MGNTQHDNKENARPWENDDSHSSDSDRVAAKLARKESLNIKLALRPDRQELINRYKHVIGTLLHMMLSKLINISKYKYYVKVEHLLCIYL